MLLVDYDKLTCKLRDHTGLLPDGNYNVECPAHDATYSLIDDESDESDDESDDDTDMDSDLEINMEREKYNASKNKDVERDDEEEYDR